MKLREGPARWKHYVTDMILYGAQVQPQEVDAVVLYLTKNFGPTSQPIAAAKTNPAALPAGAGKELVETRCALCHDLERVTGIPRTAQDWNGIVTNMIGRGAVASADEARAITTYLTAHFGER
jgi:mono/diheme cytochrome c family protein